MWSIKASSIKDAIKHYKYCKQFSIDTILTFYNITQAKSCFYVNTLQLSNPEFCSISFCFYDRISSCQTEVRLSYLSS